MRKYFSLVIIVLVTGLGCKKNTGPAVANSVQVDNRLDTLVSMSAMINGKAWQTDSVYGYRVRYFNDTTKYNLLVTATRKVNDTLSTITFTINNYQGINGYAISSPEYSATLYLGTDRHLASTGLVTIATDGNNAITGTFSFVADTFNVTSGVFNVAKP